MFVVMIYGFGVDGVLIVVVIDIVEEMLFKGS